MPSTMAERRSKPRDRARAADDRDAISIAPGKGQLVYVGRDGEVKNPSAVRNRQLAAVRRVRRHHRRRRRSRRDVVSGARPVLPRCSAAGSSAPCARSSASTRRASRCRKGDAVDRAATLAEPVTRAWWAPGRVRALAELRVAIADALEGHGEQGARSRTARARKLSPRLIQHQFSLLHGDQPADRARSHEGSARPARGPRRRADRRGAQAVVLDRGDAPRGRREPARARLDDGRAPRSDAQGPVDDGRRGPPAAVRLVLRAPRRARRRAVRVASGEGARGLASPRGRDAEARRVDGEVPRASRHPERRVSADAGDESPLPSSVYFSSASSRQVREDHLVEALLRDQALAEAAALVLASLADALRLRRRGGLRRCADDHRRTRHHDAAAGAGVGRGRRGASGSARSRAARVRLLRDARGRRRRRRGTRSAVDAGARAFCGVGSGGSPAAAAHPSRGLGRRRRGRGFGPARRSRRAATEAGGDRGDASGLLAHRHARRPSPARLIEYCPGARIARPAAARPTVALARRPRSRRCLVAMALVRWQRARHDRGRRDRGARSAGASAAASPRCGSRRALGVGCDRRAAAAAGSSADPTGMPSPGRRVGRDRGRDAVVGGRRRGVARRAMPTASCRMISISGTSRADATAAVAGAGIGGGCAARAARRRAAASRVGTVAAASRRRRRRRGSSAAGGIVLGRGRRGGGMLRNCGARLVRSAVCVRAGVGSGALLGSETRWCAWRRALARRPGAPMTRGSRSRSSCRRLRDRRPRSPGRSARRRLSRRRHRARLEPGCAREVDVDLVVEGAPVEVLHHGLVLGLHQGLDRVLVRAGVVDQLAGRDDHALVEQVREQVGAQDARILGLDVKHQSSVPDVVVVPEDG